MVLWKRNPIKIRRLFKGQIRKKKKKEVLQRFSWKGQNGETQKVCPFFLTTEGLKL